MTTTKHAKTFSHREQVQNNMNKSFDFSKHDDNMSVHSKNSNRSKVSTEAESLAFDIDEDIKKNLHIQFDELQAYLSTAVNGDLGSIDQ